MIKLLVYTDRSIYATRSSDTHLSSGSRYSDRSRSRSRSPAEKPRVQYITSFGAGGGSAAARASTGAYTPSQLLSRHNSQPAAVFSGPRSVFASVCGPFRSRQLSSYQGITVDPSQHRRVPVGFSMRMRSVLLLPLFCLHLIVCFIPSSCLGGQGLTPPANNRTFWKERQNAHIHRFGSVLTWFCGCRVCAPCHSVNEASAAAAAAEEASSPAVDDAGARAREAARAERYEARQKERALEKAEEEQRHTSTSTPAEKKAKVARGPCGFLPFRFMRPMGTGLWSSCCSHGHSRH